MHWKPCWYTPQLAASCKWSSFRDCRGIFLVVGRKKDSRRLALGFQTLRPFISSSAAPAWPRACVGEVFGTIRDFVCLEPVLCIAEPSVERQSQLWRRWRRTGLVQDISACGGMVADRFDLLVLCCVDWFFFPSEVCTKDLWSTFTFKEQWKREASDFF